MSFLFGIREIPRGIASEFTLDYVAESGDLAEQEYLGHWVEDSYFSDEHVS